MTSPINIGSGNGLVLSGDKPLPEPMLSYTFAAICVWKYHWIHTKSVHHIPVTCVLFTMSWWLHQIETFSVLLAICAANSPVTGKFPALKPVAWSFDFFICAWINGWVNNREAGDLRRTPSRPLWRHCNGAVIYPTDSQLVGTLFTHDISATIRYILVCVDSSTNEFKLRNWFICQSNSLFYFIAYMYANWYFH